MISAKYYFDWSKLLEKESDTRFSRYIYQLCFYLASRNFFQEKQSYLLTESPLYKYEGDNPFHPSILQIKGRLILTHFKGTLSQDEQKTLYVALWSIVSYYLLLLLLLCVSLSNGNASETKVNKSFDNGVFFDIQAKRTPSIVSKLFSKRSEHIRQKENYFRSEANTLDRKKIICQAQ